MPQGRISAILSLLIFCCPHKWQVAQAKPNDYRCRRRKARPCTYRGIVLYMQKGRWVPWVSKHILELSSREKGHNPDLFQIFFLPIHQGFVSEVLWGPVAFGWLVIFWCAIPVKRKTQIRTCYFAMGTRDLCTSISWRWHDPCCSGDGWDRVQTVQ